MGSLSSATKFALLGAPAIGVGVGTGISQVLEPEKDMYDSAMEMLWSKDEGIIHNGLNLLGFLPVIGDIADTLNSVIYAGEGVVTGDSSKFLMAGIYAGSVAIPGAIAARAAKLSLAKQIGKAIPMQQSSIIATQNTIKKKIDLMGSYSKEQVKKEWADLAQLSTGLRESVNTLKFLDGSLKQLDDSLFYVKAMQRNIFTQPFESFRSGVTQYAKGFYGNSPVPNLLRYKETFYDGINALYEEPSKLLFQKIFSLNKASAVNAHNMIRIKQGSKETSSELLQSLEKSNLDPEKLFFSDIAFKTYSLLGSGQNLNILQGLLRKSIYTDLDVLSIDEKEAAERFGGFIAKFKGRDPNEVSISIAKTNLHLESRQDKQDEAINVIKRIYYKNQKTLDTITSDKERMEKFKDLLLDKGLVKKYTEDLATLNKSQGKLGSNVTSHVKLDTDRIIMDKDGIHISIYPESSGNYITGKHEAMLSLSPNLQSAWIVAGDITQATTGVGAVLGKGGVKDNLIIVAPREVDKWLDFSSQSFSATKNVRKQVHKAGLNISYPTAKRFTKNLTEALLESQNIADVDVRILGGQEIAKYQQKGIILKSLQEAIDAPDDRGIKEKLKKKNIVSPPKFIKDLIDASSRHQVNSYRESKYFNANYNSTTNTLKKLNNESYTFKLLTDQKLLKKLINKFGIDGAITTDKLYSEIGEGLEGVYHNVSAYDYVDSYATWIKRSPIRSSIRAKMSNTVNNNERQN